MEIAIKSPTNPRLPSAVNNLYARSVGFDGKEILYYYELQVKTLTAAAKPAVVGDDEVVITPAAEAVYTRESLVNGNVNMTAEQFNEWAAGEGSNEPYQLECILKNLNLQPA